MAPKGFYIGGGGPISRGGEWATRTHPPTSYMQLRSDRMCVPLLSPQADDFLCMAQQFAPLGN